MTEIVRAIKYWEKFKQESVEMIAKGKDRNDILAKQVPMCDIALAALREQAERDKGCEWCDEFKYDWKYCSECGKRLEVHNE